MFLIAFFFKQKFWWGFSYGFLPIFEIQLTKSRKTNFTHFPFLWRSYGFSFFPFPFLVVANVNVPKKSVLILELENLPLYLTYYILFKFVISFFSCLNTLVCFPKKQACKARSDASSEHRPLWLRLTGAKCGGCG